MIPLYLLDDIRRQLFELGCESANLEKECENDREMALQIECTAAIHQARVEICRAINAIEKMGGEESGDRKERKRSDKRQSTER